MTYKYIPVYTIPQHCYVHCNVSVQVNPVNSHHIL